MELFLIHAAFWWELGFGNPSAFFCSFILSALGMSGFQIGSFLHPESLKMWSQNYCALRDFLLNKLWKDCIGPQIVQSFGIQIVKKKCMFSIIKSGSLNISPKIWIALQRNSICWGKQASEQASKQASKRGEMQFHPIQPWNALIGNRPENESRFQTLLTLTNIK